MVFRETRRKCEIQHGAPLEETRLFFRHPLGVSLSRLDPPKWLRFSFKEGRPQKKTRRSQISGRSFTRIPPSPFFGPPKEPPIDQLFIWANSSHPCLSPLLGTGSQKRFHDSWGGSPEISFIRAAYRRSMVLLHGTRLGTGRLP